MIHDHLTFCVFIISGPFSQRLICFLWMFFSFSKTQTLTNINQSVLMTMFLSSVADWCTKLSPMSLAGILKLRDKHLLIRQIVFKKRPSGEHHRSRILHCRDMRNQPSLQGAVVFLFVQTLLLSFHIFL